MSNSAELGLKQPDFIISQPEDESNPEVSEAERIRETAQGLRFQMLETNLGRMKRGIDSLVPKSVQVLTSTAANYIGPLGATKMAIESIRGRTFAGQKLTPLGRINHFIIQGLNGYAHYLPFKGKVGAAALAYGASWAVDAVQYYPEILSSIKDLAKKGKMDSVAATLDRLEKILDKAQIRKLFFEEDDQARQETKTE